MRAMWANASALGPPVGLEQVFSDIGEYFENNEFELAIDLMEYLLEARDNLSDRHLDAYEEIISEYKLKAVSE
ncbi:hypothetical protein [Maricaulis sp.]|uniref:hypothetical protein n=1 Tax=Maricaulis sp. TaxID=1486257 RepID=UPI00261A3DF9|nr:hypothetical protein [Maricaulis sp.]